jgi:hypothetical protein
LIFDLDKQVFVRDLKLPAIPEPAATVLLENLRSLNKKKGTFVEASTEPKEKIVIVIYKE